MNTLQALANLGRPRIRDFYYTKGANLLILGCRPQIVVGAFEGELPLSVDRSSDATPNYGYDGVKFIQDVPKKVKAFWDLQEEVFPEKKDILQATRKALAEGHCQIVSALDAKKTKDALTGGWYVLSEGHTPLVFSKKFRTWWKKNIHTCLFEYLPEEGQCWITGEKCHPLRLHPQLKVPGTGGKAAAISYNEEAYKFGGREGGENFPVSYMSGRSYVQGLLHIFEGIHDDNGNYRAFRYALPLSGDLSLAIFPDGGEDSEYLLKAMSLLDSATPREAMKDAWSRMDSWEPSERLVHILLVKGSKGRIGLLNHEVTTEKDLHQALLRVRPYIGERTLIRLIKGTGTKSLPKPKGVEGKPLIPPPLLAPVITGVLLGKPFSPALAQTVLSRFDASNSQHRASMGLLQAFQ